MIDLGVPGPLLIPVSAGATPRDLDAYLTALPADAVRLATSYTFAVSPATATDLADPSAEADRISLLRRFDKDAAVLTADETGRHQLRDLRSEGLIVSGDEAGRLSELQQRDLQWLLADAADGCIYAATRRYHFVAPSGNHCSVFVRVADALRSKDGIERVAFWLQPHLYRTSAVLCDTYGIFSPILHALQRLGSRAPFDCIRKHPLRDRAGTRSVLEGLLGALPRGGTLSYVISISSTGQHLEILSEHLLALNRSDVTLKAVSLYGMSECPRDLDVLCRLPLDSKSQPAGTCTLCDQDSRPLRLDSALYLLRQTEEQGIPLKADEFERARPFVDRYRGLGAISVHRNNANDNRHHAFYIDVLRLLQSESFVSLLETKVRAAQAADLIVTPTHMVGVELGRLASNWLGVPHIADDRLIAGDMRPADRQALERAQHLLVIDDVLITGSRMSVYNNSLRRFHGPFETIRFLVGVARLESGDQLTRQRRSLTMNHPWHAELDAVETIYLPHWDASKCPWCRESDWLRDVAGASDFPPEWLTQRMARLAEIERGILENPFLLMPGLDFTPLGNGSVVAAEGASAVETLFAVAAGLQELRHAPEARRLFPRFPLFQIFGLNNFTNYSEALIRASLLRALTIDELGESAQDDVGRVLCRCIGEQGQIEMTGEVLLAVARGLLNRESIAELTERINHNASSDQLALLARVL